MDHNIEKNSKGKIVLIKGQSQYNVLRLACDLMAQGFEKNGYDTVVIDGTKYTDMKQLIDEIRNEMMDRGLFIFSYNAIFHNVHIQNQGLYDLLGFPVFGFLVDHPYYHHIRLNLNRGNNIYIGCVDPDHVKYLNNYYPYIKNTSFLPHFSFQTNQFIPYEEKTIELYFPGSYKNPDSYQNQIDELPKVFADIARELMVQMLRDSNLTLEDTLRRYLASVNFEYSPEEFLEIMGQIFFVDHFVRDYRRDRIIRAILNSGLQLTVSGNGWDQFKEIYQDQLKIVGEGGLDIIDNVRLISESKILINIYPNFKNGTHERIFTAMRNGCVCFTDPSGYLLEHFENNETIVYYDLNKIDEIPAKIKELLDNPEFAKKIAENGYQKANSEYDEKMTAYRVLKSMGLE